MDDLTREADRKNLKRQSAPTVTSNAEEEEKEEAPTLLPLVNFSQREKHFFSNFVMEKNWNDMLHWINVFFLAPWCNTATGNHPHASWKRQAMIVDPLWMVLTRKQCCTRTLPCELENRCIDTWSCQKKCPRAEPTLKDGTPTLLSAQTITMRKRVFSVCHWRKWNFVSFRTIVLTQHCPWLSPTKCFTVTQGGCASMCHGAVFFVISAVSFHELNVDVLHSQPRKEKRMSWHWQPHCCMTSLLPGFFLEVAKCWQNPPTAQFEATVAFSQLWNTIIVASKMFCFCGLNQLQTQSAEVPFTLKLGAWEKKNTDRVWEFCITLTWAVFKGKGSHFPFTPKMSFCVGADGVLQTERGNNKRGETVFDLRNDQWDGRSWFHYDKYADFRE